jgi:UPF0755 protein
MGLMRLVGSAAALLLLIAVLVGGWVAWTYRGPGPAAASGATTTVMLERGSGVTQIARALKKAGVIGSSQVFLMAVKLTGRGPRPQGRRIRVQEPRLDGAHPGRYPRRQGGAPHGQRA